MALHRSLCLTISNLRSIMGASLLGNVWILGGVMLGKVKLKERAELTKEAIDNKEQIIKMITKIEDAGTLEYLHTFIKLFLEKWG